MVFAKDKSLLGKDADTQQRICLLCRLSKSTTYVQRCHFMFVCATQYHVCIMDLYRYIEPSQVISFCPCRAGVAQAAADEAAMMAPPSPPPEPAANALSPSRSRRPAASPAKPVKQPSKKAAAVVSPRRRSKPSAGGQQQKLVLPDKADPSLQPPAGPGVTDTPGATDASGVTDAPAPEANDDIPATLSAAIAAWQQFHEQAKGLLLGRAQSDNMVQLLSSEVEGKHPDQVVMEVKT